MKRCQNCKKEFTPARNRKSGKFCEISCYQKSRAITKDKVDILQFFFDCLQIIVPVLIVAGSILYITPKMQSATETKKEEVKEVVDSSCFDWDDDEEDAKYLEYLRKGKKK